MRIAHVGPIAGDRLSIRLAHGKEGEQRTQSRVLPSFLDQLVTDPVRLHGRTSELGVATRERERHTSRTDRVSISMVACEIDQSKIKSQVILRLTIERAGIQVAHPANRESKSRRSRSLANSRCFRKRQLAILCRSL